jgi:hypothetical protein
MTKDMQILLDYCKDTIQDFEERVSMAIDKIAYWRCSLEYADPDLYDEIADAIADCAEDYGIDSDNITEEDVIWA